MVPTAPAGSSRGLKTTLTSLAGKRRPDLNALTPGGRIDETKTVKSVRIAVLTISDTRDEESDTSGAVLAQRIADAGHELADRAIVRDSVEAIREKIEAWAASGFVEAIITTGGTGITGRD